MNWTRREPGIYVADSRHGRWQIVGHDISIGVARKARIYSVWLQQLGGDSRVPGRYATLRDAKAEVDRYERMAQ